MATEVIHCANTGKQEVAVQFKPQGLWICSGCGREVKHVVTTK